jgi:hypothetical protein
VDPSTDVLIHVTVYPGQGYILFLMSAHPPPEEFVAELEYVYGY